MKPSELLERVRSSSTNKWTMQEAVACAASITRRAEAGELSARDVIGEALDLAVHKFPASNVDEAQLRKFCWELVVLSVLAVGTPFSGTTLKAVVSSIHILIDKLSDYDLAIDYCKFVFLEAKTRELWPIATIASGDLGIAQSRLGNGEEAIAHLEDAVELALAQNDHCAAARYGSEAGRCHFALGDRVRSRQALEAALSNASDCGDAELRSQIEANLRVLGVH